MDLGLVPIPIQEEWSDMSKIRRLGGFPASAICGLALLLMLARADSNRPNYGFWTAAQLAAVDQKMYANMDATKGAHIDLMATRNSYFMVSHREATAPKAEVHEKHGDFGYIRGGEGIILTGGKFVDVTKTGLEERGTIQGGVEHHLVAGDAFYVPAGMPHRMVVQPGKKFTFEILKVEQKDGSSDIKEFRSWDKSKLASMEKALHGKMDQMFNGVENIVETDYSTAMMNHKEGSAESEIHEHLAEFQIILTGQGAMMLGGKVVNQRSIGPGEIRGTALDGATRQPLMPGDMLYIPENTPHHTIVDRDKFQDKLIVKVWVR
jgi:mannose-6-phosphate isomerase-like protein (cupin superfamily)